MTKRRGPDANGTDASSAPDTDELELVRRALASLKYGEIVIAVHDGKIVQIARTEKIRPPSRT